MSERARIIAWWGYVICVIVIFEVVFQLSGFGPALFTALASIAILGSLLKLIIARRTRRPRRTQPDKISGDAG
jgi:predicted CDP-diglyceride synthetase/phosphatidate cytidylyltransferase